MNSFPKKKLLKLISFYLSQICLITSRCFLSRFSLQLFYFLSYVFLVLLYHFLLNPLDCVCNTCWHACSTARRRCTWRVRMDISRWRTSCSGTRPSSTPSPSSASLRSTWRRPRATTTWWSCCWRRTALPSTPARWWVVSTHLPDINLSLASSVGHRLPSGGRALFSNAHLDWWVLRFCLFVFLLLPNYGSKVPSLISDFAL